MAEVLGTVDTMPDEAVQTAATTETPSVGFGWNRPTAAWTSVGLAAVSAGLTVFFLVEAGQTSSDHKALCPDTVCTPDNYPRGLELQSSGQQNQAVGNLFLALALTFGVVSGALFVFHELDWIFD